MLVLGKRLLASFTLSAAIVAVAANCGGGASEEDATTFCDQERTATPSCFTDAVYKACYDCYIECGQDCVRGGACPEQYSCEE